MYTPDTVRHEIRGRLNGGVQMSHIVVYWIDDAMYTEAFTKLEYAEKRIEEIKDTQGYSAYELYATKLLRVEEPVSERAAENVRS